MLAGSICFPWSAHQFFKIKMNSEQKQNKSLEKTIHLMKSVREAQLKRHVISFNSGGPLL